MFRLKPPGSVSGNLSIFLPVSITNRVDSNSVILTHDAILSVDFGSGFVPTGIAGQIANQIIAFNGSVLPCRPPANCPSRYRNLRAAVHQFGAVQATPCSGQLAFSSTASISIDQSQPVVAYAQTGLLAPCMKRHHLHRIAVPSP